MSTEQHDDNIIKVSTEYNFKELEKLILNAKDISERELYASLLDKFITENFPRVLVENPF